MNQKGMFEGNTAKLEQLQRVLQDVPKDYQCYIQNVDSIYPVQDLNMGMLGENDASFSSCETYGRKVKVLTVKEVFEKIERILKEQKCVWVYAEQAENIDPDLDCQLDETRGISSWEIDNICRYFILKTGKPYGYC